MLPTLLPLKKQDGHKHIYDWRSYGKINTGDMSIKPDLFVISKALYRHNEDDSTSIRRKTDIIPQYRLIP